MKPMKKTLSMWFAENPSAGFQRHSNGGIQVFSRDPELWHLLNYKVDGALSGPSVWMRPIQTGWFSCRTFGQYGTEQYCVCQDYTAQYLTRDGSWGSPMEAATFGSYAEADKFAIEKLLMPLAEFVFEPQTAVNS